MRTKTRYREIQPDNSAQNIPAEKELPPVAVVSAPPEGPTVAVESQPQGTAPEPIPAAEALKAQLEALKMAEQRQQAAHMAASQPVTREQKLDLWRRQGLSADEARFLEQHPAMIDFPEVATVAANEALQAGHERNSEPYWSALKMNFNNHLDRLRSQAKPTEQPTTTFFQPPPPAAPPTRANIYSAPVSRGVPSSGPRPENPSRMTLTAEEAQVAAASGISAAEYARGKLRLQREKASGERQ